MSVCAVCGKPAEQRHHISYDPEMEIPICLACHKKVHIKHGVGPAVGGRRSRVSIDDTMRDLIIANRAARILAERVSRRPIFTRTTVDGFRQPVVDADSGVLLNQLVCGCSHGFDFILYENPETHTMYLKCPGCGCDWLLTAFRASRPDEIVGGVVE